MGIETGVLLAYAAVASAGVAATAAIMSGEQAKETADTNAELARRQGVAEQDAALAQAEKIRRAARSQAAEANAGLAASGIAIGEGTPVRINEQIYANAEQDAYATLLTGSRRASNANAQATISEWQGQNAQTAGYLNAGATLLSTAAKVGKGWNSTPSSVSAGPDLGTGLKAPATGFWGK